jgi:large subunit ribosomal protein L24
MQVKKGDNVTVLSGKDKGKKGLIVKSFPKEGKVLIEGINMVKRHKRAGRGVPGAIISMPMPMHASKVAKI